MLRALLYQSDCLVTICEWNFLDLNQILSIPLKTVAHIRKEKKNVFKIFFHIEAASLIAISQSLKYPLCGNFLGLLHPWAGEDLSFKIDEQDQTIWNCILESQLFHSSQMKLKLAGSFFQKSTIWRWAQSKMHRIKKLTVVSL